MSTSSITSVASYTAPLPSSSAQPKEVEVLKTEALNQLKAARVVVKEKRAILENLEKNNSPSQEINLAHHEVRQAKQKRDSIRETYLSLGGELDRADQPENRIRRSADQEQRNQKLTQKLMGSTINGQPCICPEKELKASQCPSSKSVAETQPELTNEDIAHAADFFAEEGTQYQVPQLTNEDITHAADFFAEEGTQYQVPQLTNEDIKGALGEFFEGGAEGLNNVLQKLQANQLFNELTAGWLNEQPTKDKEVKGRWILTHFPDPEEVMNTKEVVENGAQMTTPSVRASDGPRVVPITTWFVEDSQGYLTDAAVEGTVVPPDANKA